MKIIVPLRITSWSNLKKIISEMDSRVDLIEIWLDQLLPDFLQNPYYLSEARHFIQMIKSQSKTQFLGVCKTREEAGDFTGGSLEKIQILKQFLFLGGDFVDLDIARMPKSLITGIPSKNLWLSFHDFESFDLSQCEEYLKKMKDLDPFLYKFAVTPKNSQDLENFVAWAQKANLKNAIFTTMGPLGQEGRKLLSSLNWGSFYALTESHKTASGQSLLEELLT